MHLHDRRHKGVPFLDTVNISAKQFTEYSYFNKYVPFKSYEIILPYITFKVDLNY